MTDDTAGATTHELRLAINLVINADNVQLEIAHVCKGQLYATALALSLYLNDRKLLINVQRRRKAG